ncbi:MAG: polysaccharide export protein [Phycisphaerales bacterium]|nr:polysaccharide export protein [Phycisphaerales bacterium]
MNSRVDGYFRTGIVRLPALAAFVAWCVMVGGCNMPTDMQPTGSDFGAPPAVEGAEPQRPISASSLPYTLVPGDRIAIRVYQDPNLDGEYTIDSDGGIQYPLVGPMRLEGLTTADARRKIASGLQGNYVDPSVTVNLISQMQQYVRVMGQVPKQGRVAYQRGMTILDALADAGGPTRDASLRKMVLIRRMSDEFVAAGLFDYREMMLNPSIESLSANIPLERGDIIFVPTNERAQWESAFQFISTMFGAAVDVERGIVLYPDVREILQTGDSSTRTTVIVR